MSLVPDEYGKHLQVKMLTKYNEEGEFLGHIKLDEKAIDILTNGYFMPAKPEYDEV
tara:strand:+ start:14259 stop:14426 length:168 start_codon:yes stop_codon:yes gene_type:complete